MLKKSLMTGLLLCGYGALGAPEPATPANPSNAAAGKGTPSIQFETNFFDFGKLMVPGAISGVFKFKNAGDGILKVDPPVPSCGCTDARVKPDTLAPGESGEIAYSINLDRPMQGVQKHIKVHSNDPKTPDVQLTMQLDYTPLYELNPKMLHLTLAAGENEALGSFTVTRNDGKPLDIEKLLTSQKWVDAAIDPSSVARTTSARVNVKVHRPADPPSTFAVSVQLWASNQMARPVQTLMVAGEMQGELSTVPSQIYWVIPDFGESKTNYPAAALTRKVELKSLLGKNVELRNASTSVKGLNVEIVPEDPGKSFGLILKFDELPRTFTKGKVTVETSLASLPKVEVPVTISVPNPN